MASPTQPPTNQKSLETNTSFEINADQLTLFTQKKSTRSSRPEVLALIIDDQVFFHAILSELLPRPMKLLESDNLTKGWEIYIDQAPDILFLDINFPEGKGHTLAKKIREIDSEAFIVMISGVASVEDVTAAKQNHVEGYITKPFNKTKIHECINRFKSIAKRN